MLLTAYDLSALMYIRQQTTDEVLAYALLRRKMVRCGEKIQYF